MKRELSKTYSPSDMEDRIYANWMDKGYFHSEVDEAKKPFTIVIPPPNITSQLHIGHALDDTIQDILIRFKRMQGYNALWQPGTDHASIATEVKIIESLKKEGKSKEDLGRDGFLERAWQWRAEYGGRIVEQLKRMGFSCDWSRERFTMDEGNNEAVTEAFLRLYEKGYIYQGNRIINWCPVCNTSISEAEVEYESSGGYFWHIKYPIKDSDEYLVVATTRPETMLGDTAIAVNPEDTRYTHLIGKVAILPIVNREIAIIADSYVDKDFGTGAVKITPAHDPNDFEVGKRHNLEEINVMNDDATINSYGGCYEGMDRYEARKAIVEELKASGYLIKIEEHEHNVGTHDRCGCVIEPMIKKQWFVRMEELIEPAVSAVRDKEIRLVPDRMDKIFYNWTDNIKDWCISRQLWWGHRIPAYICDKCGHTVVSKIEPKVCDSCGAVGSMVQDPDVLDTWFSSALWPFATLGWPNHTKELDYYYPTDVLVTGYDIIFFWVIRMIFSGYEHMKVKPFSNVLFHGLIRDSMGRKMSKSLGNGIDPLEIIDKYGADALRLTLVTGNAPGSDMRFYYERVESSRNFANKVWNASRFIMMNLENIDSIDRSIAIYEDSDRWIRSIYNNLVREVTSNLEGFELGIAVSKVWDFVWNEFCDWYIEIVKPRLYNHEAMGSRMAALHTLIEVLVGSLKLLHPYIPFITEEIYMSIKDYSEDNDCESIMISSWPIYLEEYNNPDAEANLELIKDAIKGIRNIRTNINVPNNRKSAMYLVSQDEEVRKSFCNAQDYIKSMAMVSSVAVSGNIPELGEEVVTVIIDKATVYLPLDELIDKEEELVRLTKEETKLVAEIARVESMLNNPKFIDKAPESKVNEERAKLDKYTNMLEDVRGQLERIRK